tara:strand:+ start:464 stop:1069 length:606 start_codon:yes stop_codon:yes gene_type:complete
VHLLGKLLVQRSRHLRKRRRKILRPVRKHPLRPLQSQKWNHLLIINLLTKLRRGFLRLHLYHQLVKRFHLHLLPSRHQENLYLHHQVKEEEVILNLIEERLRIGHGRMVKAPKVGKIAQLADGPPLAVLIDQPEVQALLLQGLSAQLQPSPGLGARVAAQEVLLNGPREKRRVDGAADKKNYSQWMRQRTPQKTRQFQRAK